MVCLYITAEVPPKAIMKSTRTWSNFLVHCSGCTFVGLASAQCSQCFQVKMVQMFLASLLFQGNMVCAIMSPFWPFAKILSPVTQA